MYRLSSPKCDVFTKQISSSLFSGRFHDGISCLISYLYFILLQQKNLIMKLFHYYLMALLIIIVSCSKPEPSGGIMITKEMKDLPTSKLSELVDSLSYIQLETSEECMMGGAALYRTLVTPLGLVFYCSACMQEPILFSYEGDFIGKIGRIGKGPGEFLYPRSVTYDVENEQFLIVNYHTVHLYSSDLKHIRSISLDIENRYASRIVVLPDNRMALLYHLQTATTLNEIGVLIMDYDGEIIKEYILTDENQWGSYRGTWSSNKLYINRGKLIFSIGRDKQILSLSKADKWEEECSVNYYFPPCPKNILKLLPDLDAYTSYQQDNPVAIYGVLSGKFLQVSYNNSESIHQHKGVELYIDLSTKQVYKCDYFRAYHGYGLINDLDGGRPVQIKSFSGDKSYELIDMDHIFWDIEYMANDSVNVNPAMHKVFKDLLEDLEEHHNPIIRISHLKKL